MDFNSLVTDRNGAFDKTWRKLHCSPPSFLPLFFTPRCCLTQKSMSSRYRLRSSWSAAISKILPAILNAIYFRPASRNCGFVSNMSSLANVGIKASRRNGHWVGWVISLIFNRTISMSSHCLSSSSINLSLIKCH